MCFSSIGGRWSALLGAAPERRHSFRVDRFYFARGRASSMTGSRCSSPARASSERIPAARPGRSASSSSAEGLSCPEQQVRRGPDRIGRTARSCRPRRRLPWWCPRGTGSWSRRRRCVPASFSALTRCWLLPRLLDAGVVVGHDDQVRLLGQLQRLLHLVVGRSEVRVVEDEVRWSAWPSARRTCADGCTGPCRGTSRECAAR